jgi:transcriptional regulator with XRE-family HTH domain
MTYTTERKRLLRAFGKKLRSERERLGFTQKEFAAATGLHRNEIGYLERGKQEPYLLTLLILKQALGVPLEDLTKDLPAPNRAEPAQESP